MKKRILAVLQSAVFTLTAAAGQFALPVRAADEKDGPQLTECELRITPDAGPVYPTSPSRSTKSGRKSAAKSDNPQITVQGMLPEDVCAAAVTVDPDVYIEPTKDAILYAYDISLYSQDMVYEPENEPILVSVSGGAIRNAIDAGTKLTVVHIPDDPSEPVAYIQDLSLNGDTLSFTTDSFSVYLIKEGDDGVVQTNRHVYHYLTGDMDASGEITNTPYEFPAVNESGIVTNVSSQIVRDGNYLTEPAVPGQQNGQSFLGWYIVGEVHGGDAAAGASFTWPDGDTIDSRRVSFSEPVSVPEGTENDNIHYYLAPLYRDYRIVRFHEYLPTGNMIYSQKMVVLGTSADNTLYGKVRLDDVKAPDHGSDNYFYGWKVETGSSNGSLQREYTTRDEHSNYIETYFVFADSDFALNPHWADSVYIDLIPMHQNGHWLNYNTRDSDATYFAPSFVTQTGSNLKITSELLQSHIPVWPGYRFDGWYLDEGGSQQLSDADGNLVSAYSGGYPMSGDMTIYAKWTYMGGTAQYKYIYWVQVATDSADDFDNSNGYVTYDSSSPLHHSFLRSVTAEGEAGSGHMTPDPQVFTQEDADAGITPDGFVARMNGPKMIEPDGTTVVNIYYNRKVRTLTFRTHDRYTATSSSSGTLYGYVDGSYVLLTRGTQAYTVRTRYTYTPITTGNEGQSYYGNSYYIWDNYNTYSTISYSNRVYYHAGAFYQTRNGNTYSNPVTVYSRSTAETDYSGVRYTRSSGRPYSYSATDSYSGTLYGLDSNGHYTELRITSTTINTDRFYDPEGNEYTGQRYTKSTSNSQWYDYKTITGLYGQTFTQAGDSWPTGYDWYNGHNGNSVSGTRYSFLDGFTEDTLSLSEMYGTTASTSGTNIVRFYKQGFGENEWILANTFRTSGTSFTLSEKYQGFKLSEYSSNGGTWNPATAEETVTFRNTLDIHFARESYELIFLDGNDDVAHPYNVYSVLYETDLTAYANEPKPPDTEDFTYIGWSLDLEQVPTMPAHNLVIYAERQRPVYQVILDTDGGEFQNDSYSTFFKLRYPNYKIEEYLLSRNYRPVNAGESGDYVFIYVEPDENFEPPIDPDTGEEMKRYAKYVRKDTPEAAKYADWLAKDGNGNIQYYRLAADMDGRDSLVYWYEVDYETGEPFLDDDGNPIETPYNFAADAKHNTRLRAKWMNTGAQFTVQYEAVTEVNGVQVGGEMANGSNMTGVAGESVITVAAKPVNITETPDDPQTEYVFEYWEVAGTRVMPGDQLRITSAVADSNLVVTIRAVYAKASESIHNQQLMHLRLHANYIADGASVEETYMGEELQNMQQNHRVDLAPYETTFTREHYRLVGWSTKPNADDPDAVVFPLNAQVGAYLDQPGVPGDADSFTSHLYAVWEQIPPAPTGVHDSKAPYLLMVVIAASLMAAVIYRRKEGMHNECSPL